VKNPIASGVVFVAALAFLLATGRDRGGYRIDEAHKVADTYFFHLLTGGELRHPDWFRHIADRTNPPVGKFLFGFSSRLHGARLPDDLTMRVEEPDGSLGQRLRGDEHQFDDVLRASRRVSIVATAATAAVVFSTAAFAAGIPAGILGAVLYLAHYLTLTFAGTAVYDPLLTLFVALSALPLVHLANAAPRRRMIVSAVAAGVFAAAAFQTRLSGVIGLAVLLVVALVAWAMMRKREAGIFALVALAVFAVASIAVNPFYWSSPRTSVSELPASGALPFRIIDRFTLQIRELSELLARQSENQEVLSWLGAKASFAAEILLGDAVGMVMLLGWGIAAFFLLRGAAPGRTRSAIVLAWSGLIIAMLVLWLPLAWPRYLLVAIPPAAIGGAVGWGLLLNAVVSSQESGASSPPTR
jgi:4-amino-4-deoxy-L-arabinose transferase-like glycosyltransferase